MKRSIKINIFFATIFSLCLQSCKDDDVKTLSSIKIFSELGERMPVGESSRLSVEGFDQNEAPIKLTASVNWSVDNNNAVVSNEGILKAEMPGISTITADVNGISDKYEVMFWDSAKPRTEIYVSDAADFNNGPFRIFKYDIENSISEVYIDSNLDWPQDILFLEDRGQVLISNFNSGRITRYKIETGEYVSDFATGLNAPTRMKIGPDNLLYVLQWNGDGVVKRYQLDGTFVDDFTSSGVLQSIGIDWDNNGNLYVSSFNKGLNAPGFVQKFSETGEDLGKFISNSLNGPTNIWFEATGNLLVIDYSKGEVKRFNTEGALLGSVISGLQNPEGISFYNDDILIGDGGTGTVKQFNSSFEFVKNIVSTSNSGGLKTPNAINVRYINH